MPYALRNQKILVPSTGRTQGTGWLPPVYDPRDYTPTAPQLAAVRDRLQEKLKKHKVTAFSAPPTSVDLRQWCSPIEDQGQLGSCTAHAAVGVVEYFERRAFGKHLDGSRLFVYKATRNLIGVTGDTGAWLRNAMGALVMCGVPEERHWMYTDSQTDFDKEPPPFVYAVADNFESTKYFAHDPLSGNVAPAAIVASVKKHLAAGIPSMFGFWGYESFDSGDAPGHIPLPTPLELAGDPAWGHAIVAIGYDDKKKITNTASNKTTTGAFLIRNSWGTTWGAAGYGWMPYDYVLKRVAMDFWSLIDMEYVDCDQFYD
jgi:C1A family cysteine protease